MRAYRMSSTRNLRAAASILFFVVSVVGCHESTTSPCYDCGPAVIDGRYTEIVERQLTVDDGATVWVDDFVGTVKYRTGGGGTVRVVATKCAARRSDLDCIELTIIAHESGLDIRAANPAKIHNASVDLEITAPADAIPRIAAGVGDIDYRGHPRGACCFTTGVGSVRISLPADVNVAVELSVGVGTIFLGFPVDGVVSSPPNFVKGTIGNGGEGSVHATAGVGSIYLTRQ
jgi:hypothetical protein